MLRSICRALVAAMLLAACDGGEDVAPDRLPRFEPPTGPAPRVALVLGSGGPRGFAHIGVLKVLDEAGIAADLVIGSSVGAMVGALYAGGYDARRLEKLAHEINVLEFFEFRMLGGGLAKGHAVQSFMNTRLGGRPIEALPVRFAAAATRVSDAGLALFNRGDVGLAVRASSASPGQFEPVRIGDEAYIDGDEASPVPIRAARELGARVVIAVDVSAHAATTPAGVPQDWIDKDARRARQVAEQAPLADVLLHPDIGYYAGHDAEYRRRVIDLAERYTREKLPEIRAALRPGVPAQAGIRPPYAGSTSTARMPAAETSR